MGILPPRLLSAAHKANGICCQPWLPCRGTSCERSPHGNGIRRPHVRYASNYDLARSLIHDARMHRAHLNAPHEVRFGRDAVPAHAA